MSGRKSEPRDFIGLVNFGIFLFLVGIIFIITPNLPGEIVDFFGDFTLIQVAPNFYLPVVESPHPVVYYATFQFCLAFGLAQIGILAARFVFKESVRRKVGEISGIVFWLGAAWIFYLLYTNAIPFQSIYSYGIIVIGVSIMVIGIGYYLGSAMKPKQPAT